MSLAEFTILLAVVTVVIMAGGLTVSIVTLFRVHDLHVIVNSRLSQLVDAEKGKSHGEGIEEGRALSATAAAAPALPSPAAVKVVTGDVETTTITKVIPKEPPNAQT